MKTLVLSVDRDDDLGHKAGLETPIIGRRRMVEAATAMGLADPEDSDTNGLFAAVHLFDREARAAEHKGRQFEVAAITGHRAMGLRGDRKLAKELDEVLELTRADEVILVSDGAEDEQILPILSSRVRVAHVHRTIVRQAPRLEGMFYILTRLMDDKKLAQRYILPLGLIAIVWAAAVLLDIVNYAWGTTLALIGIWLVVHAMHWEERLGRFFTDFGATLRTGKLSLLGNVIAVGLLVLGALQSYGRLPSAVDSTTLQTLFFLEEYILYVVSALLIRTAGLLMDEYIRTGQASLRHWTAGFTLIAFGFIGSVTLEIGIGIMENVAVEHLLTFDRVVRILAGTAVMMAGILLARYVRGYVDASR